MSNSVNNIDNFINTLNQRHPNINSNVQFFLDMIQNELEGPSQDIRPLNNNNIEQISELFRNFSELRSSHNLPSQRVSVGSNNRNNSHRSREVDSTNEFSDALGQNTHYPTNMRENRIAGETILHSVSDSGSGTPLRYVPSLNRRNSRTNSFVDELNDIPTNPATYSGTGRSETEFRTNSLEQRVLYSMSYI